MSEAANREQELYAALDKVEWVEAENRELAAQVAVRFRLAAYLAASIETADSTSKNQRSALQEWKDANIDLPAAAQALLVRLAQAEAKVEALTEAGDDAKQRIEALTVAGDGLRNKMDDAHDYVIGGHGPCDWCAALAAWEKAKGEGK